MNDLGCDVPQIRERLVRARTELEHHLREGIMPFWTKRAIDERYGGYFTCFDA